MTPYLQPLLDWIAQHPTAWAVMRPVGVLFLAWLSFYVARGVLVRWLATWIRASRSRIDDVLLDSGVLRRVSLLAPILVLTHGVELLPGPTETLLQVIDAGFTIVIAMIVAAGIGAFQQAAAQWDARSEVPIKSYAQVAKLLVYVIGGLLTVAVFTGKSPWVLLSGVGALMAVVILIFRDTILSLVASFTIASNRIVRVGDWIEAPAFGADGDVIDIALHTVKVQNWDKTITTIPTYKLVDESFKNWRGMQESGGRRIKRALYLDMNAVRFCDTQMLDRFERFELIRDYVHQRRHEVEAENTKRGVDLSELVNGRRLTNLGTFRAYVAAYLHQHPRIHQDLTFLVRQLQPTAQGLPLEIYVFTNTTVWADYENIQSDVFDHLLAVIPQFELRVFQEPSGADLAAALKR